MAFGGVGNGKSVRWWQSQVVLGARVLPGGGSGWRILVRYPCIGLVGTRLCGRCACRTATECTRGGCERVPVGVDRGERQPDLACGDPDPGGDLEQFHAQGSALRLGPARACQAQAPQAVHENIGKGRKIQPQLVGAQRRRAGAVGEQVELALLDTIFHVAAGAIRLLVEPLRPRHLAAQAGHHEARVGPLRQMLRLGHHPACAAPGGPGPVAKLPETPRRWSRIDCGTCAGPSRSAPPGARCEPDRARNPHRCPRISA